MPIFSKTRALAAAAFVLSAYAVETHVWQSAEQSDYEKATLKNIALRSDGRLSLAPVFKEVMDTSVGFLWALAEDSKGRLYAGGGSPSGSQAKLYVREPDGKSKVLAELEGLEIHAIAIDKRDRVYAATAPDGKVFRIGGNGKAELFYDPKAKYIWAMAFNSKGELIVATGDRGEIHKVGADGKGSVFFQTDETHARSLVIDGNDNLIVGTEPGGLVIRVSPAGEGFVLYQTAKREVTAVAVGKDGVIYAAAVGNKPAPATLPSPQPAPPPAPAPAAGTGGQQRAAQPPPPTLNFPAPGVAGGSEVYRIQTDGYPRRIWSQAQDLVYTLAFDRQNRLLIGTGNRGKIYRLETDNLHSLLVTSSSTQITAFAASARNGIYAATANVSKVYQLGPDLEKEGTLDSDVYDVGSFAQWGRLHFQGQEAGGKVGFATRSGNLDRPQKNWSQWTDVPLDSMGGRIGSPAARFVQYRLRLTAAGDGKSPEVSSVEVAYLPRNVAPVIDEIEATPQNYRFPQNPLNLTASQSITLPAMGQKKRAASTAAIDSSGTTMNYAKGHVGVRWLAADDNGDTLLYKVEIRGVNESTWKVLKEKIRERYVSWDSTSYPDGEYRLRITATDSPSNPPDLALSASRESDPILVDNTPPKIANLAAAPNGGKVTIRWRAKDALSNLDKAEYSVNGGDWTVVEPTTKLTDSQEHDYVLTLDKTAGEMTVAVRVTDEYDNVAVEKVVVKP